MNVLATKQRELRLQRRYGLSAAQYDAMRAGQGVACALCTHVAKLRAWKASRRITGFVCWGCGYALRLYQRFPQQRALLSAEAQDRIARLLPRLACDDTPDGSLSLRERRSESVKVFHSDSPSSQSTAQRQVMLADLTEAERRATTGDVYAAAVAAELRAKLSTL